MQGSKVPSSQSSQELAFGTLEREFGDGRFTIDCNKLKLFKINMPDQNKKNLLRETNPISCGEVTSISYCKEKNVKKKFRNFLSIFQKK